MMWRVPNQLRTVPQLRAAPVISESIGYRNSAVNVKSARPNGSAFWAINDLDSGKQISKNTQWSSAEIYISTEQESEPGEATIPQKKRKFDIIAESSDDDVDDNGDQTSTDAEAIKRKAKTISMLQNLIFRIWGA